MDFLDISQEEESSQNNQPVNDAPFEVVFTDKMRYCLDIGHQSHLLNVPNITMATELSNADTKLNAIGVLHGGFARLVCSYTLRAAALFGESFSYQILT